MILRNPVLQRELLEHLRHPRSFLLQGIFLGLLAGIVLLAWPPETRLLLNEARSQRIFSLFATGQFLIISLLVPVLAAPAIAGERERKSLELLLTTPLDAGSIVFGKFASAVAYLLLMAVSSLPVAATCLLLGGVGPREIIGAYVLLLAGGAFTGALSLLLSAGLGRTRNALAIAYAALAPMLVLIVALRPMLQPERAWVVATLLLLGVFACLPLAAARVRTAAERTPRTAEEEETEEQIGLVLDPRRFPDHLISPRGTGRPIPLAADPLFEKEMRWELFGQGTLLVRVLLQVSLFVSVGFIFLAYHLETSWIYSSYLIGFLLLIGPALTAGCFTMERERQTADLLLSLPLPPGRILRAKLLANLRVLGILLGLPAPFLLIIWFFLWARFRIPLADLIATTVVTVAVLCGTLLLVVMVTTLVSLLSRTTLRAMIASYLILLLPLAASIPLFRFLRNLLGLEAHRIRWILYLSPFHGLQEWESGASEGGAAILVYLFLATLATVLAGAMLRLLYGPYFRFRHDRKR